MREIKFRAWWKDAGMMVEVDTLRPKGGIEFFVEVSYGNLKIKELQVLDEPTQYVLLQYTGLKDKNGVEIYEGDIVIGRNHKDEAGASRVVEWSNSGYHANNLPVWAINKCEVIGNIYENPELLTKPK